MILDIKDDFNLVNFRIQLERILRRGFQPTKSELDFRDSRVLSITVINKIVIIIIFTAVVQPEVN